MRNQLDRAKAEYMAGRYPGDLASEILTLRMSDALPKKQPSIKFGNVWWWTGGAGSAVAAAVVGGMLYMGSGSKNLGPIPQPVAGSGEKPEIVVNGGNWTTVGKLPRLDLGGPVVEPGDRFKFGTAVGDREGRTPQFSGDFTPGMSLSSPNGKTMEYTPGQP